MKKKINKLFLEKTNNTTIQFFRYFFIMGLMAIINISFLYFLTDFMHIYYVLSNIISFMLGLIVNYGLSVKYIFNKERKGSPKVEFIVYGVIGVCGLGFDTLLLIVFTEWFGIYYMISKLISTAIVFIWNFGARKTLYIIKNN